MENEDKNRVPKLRYPGYTDPWVLRKLGEVVTKVNKTSEEDELPRVEYEDIISGQGVLNRNIFEKESKKKGIEFKYGDTLFGKLRPYLKNWLLAEFSGIAVGDWWVLRSDELDSKFLYSLIQTPRYQAFANLSIGTKMPRSDWKVVSKTEFEIPKDREEQQAIGSLFKKLDDLIALQQRKIEHLRKRKAGLLQKMFPKDGADVPEVRFPEYTDAWVLRKLGGISDNTFGGGTPKTSEKKYWNGTIPWIQSSDLTINNLFLKKTKKFITENAISESATKVVPAQSIAVVTRVGVGKLALIPFTYTTSQDFLSFSNLNIDKYFAVYNMYALLKKISQNLQGTSIKGVTKSDLLDKKIYVSNFIEEQQAIGSLFKKIDSLIVLQQRKLEHLELQKRGLLQQMFV